MTRLVSWKRFPRNMLSIWIKYLMTIFTKEEMNVDMAGVAGARMSSILLHLHRTHIVLKNDIIFKFVTLFFHEIPKPQCVWQIVAETNYFGFGGAFYV